MNLYNLTKLSKIETKVVKLHINNTEFFSLYVREQLSCKLFNIFNPWILVTKTIDYNKSGILTRNSQLLFDFNTMLIFVTDILENPKLLSEYCVKQDELFKKNQNEYNLTQFVNNSDINEYTMKN